MLMIILPAGAEWGKRPPFFLTSKHWLAQSVQQEPLCLVASAIKWSPHRGREAHHCVVLLFAAFSCTHTHPLIVVFSHAVCLTAAITSSPVLSAAVPPSFHLSLVALLDCSPANKAWFQSACRQLLSGPGGSRLYGGASCAVSALQQMQKREKSFGKMFTSYMHMNEWHVRVSRILIAYLQGKRHIHVRPTAITRSIVSGSWRH